MPESTEREASAQPVPARLWRRLAALIYDVVGAFALLYFSMLPLPALTDDPITAHHPWYLAVQIYMVGVLFLYFAWCWRRGRTLGMLSWGLMITNRNLAAVSWGESAKRFLFAIPSLGFFGLGLAWQLFDKDGLALHDRWSGTMLVAAPRRTRKK